MVRFSITGEDPALCAFRKIKDKAFKGKHTDDPWGPGTRGPRSANPTTISFQRYVIQSKKKKKKKLSANFNFRFLGNPQMFYKNAKLECALVKVGSLEVLCVVARPAALSQLTVMTESFPQSLPASTESSSENGAANFSQTCVLHAWQVCRRHLLQILWTCTEMFNISKRYKTLTPHQDRK